MGKSLMTLVITLSALFLLGSQCNHLLVVCEDGVEQECFCPDGTLGNQMCRPDGRGWKTCDCTFYSTWCDEETDLCWQDPPKDAYTADDPGLTQPDAIRYCEELVYGGYGDWYLPNIDELRTLISGNSKTQSGGDCPITEGSPRSDMFDPACGPLDEYEGPGDGGCYWLPDLTGPCDRPDPAAEGHPLETISSTVASDDEFWVACVLFDKSATAFNHIYSLADVRCVRPAPSPPITCADGPAEVCVPGTTRQCSPLNGKTGSQSCADDGKCWGPCDYTGFEPSSPILDICNQCDQVNLTIRVADKLTRNYEMLLAFLFTVEGWTIPPQRPPDGGTEDNQVINPDIDLDKPLELTIPACSYYRDRCIPPGDYYVYVSLLQSDGMPPFPQEGDYLWGYDQQALSLNSGIQQEIDIEITLLPYEEQ